MTLSATVTKSFFAALSWAAERDATYRDTQELREASDSRLDDMGICRANARGMEACAPREPRLFGPQDERPSVLGASRSSARAVCGPSGS